MRGVVLSAALCGLAWLASGCETSPKSAVTPASYQCPACKDTVIWVYGTGPQKGIPSGRKQVTHTCSACRQEWVSGISTSNECARCNAKDEKCPTCKAHGG